MAQGLKTGPAAATVRQLLARLSTVGRPRETQAAPAPRSSESAGPAWGDAAAGRGVPASERPNRRYTRRSHDGAHQFARPSSVMVAGTRTHRTRVASTTT